MFVDQVMIRVQAGRGGDGCESYLRRSDKKFTPTGGDGGGGGNVLIRADRTVTTLKGFRPHQLLRAEAGQPGSGNQKRGRSGEDLILRVPLGTTAYNQSDHLLIRDFQTDQEEVVLLKGGRGGRGNAHGREATQGEPGAEIDLMLSLKIPADLFLVGWPNSGKSTLLQRLTGARVKSESYPFSTQEPRLGKLETKNFYEITVCELPSLTLGSSQGKGLGNRFLTHLERAKLLFLVLDPLQAKFDLRKSYEILCDEVSAYKPEFTRIPHFVLVSKIDDPSARERISAQALDFAERIFLVSGMTGEGIDALVEEAEKILFHEKVS